jgi:hypothetical protein
MVNYSSRFVIYRKKHYNNSLRGYPRREYSEKIGRLLQYCTQPHILSIYPLVSLNAICVYSMHPNNRYTQNCLNHTDIPAYAIYP